MSDGWVNPFRFSNVVKEPSFGSREQNQSFEKLDRQFTFPNHSNNQNDIIARLESLEARIIHIESLIKDIRERL